jgi:ComF family protein
MQPHVQTLNDFSNGILNLILPPRCFNCGEILSENHSLCPTCWNSCVFISPPWCNLCGWPFPYEVPDKYLCPHCFRLPPEYVQCRSALAYQEGSRPFILKFKQGDGTHLAPGLAKIMLRVGNDILSRSDLLIPVPLHWKRLFLRQYNQASLLSTHLSELTGVPTHTGILKRIRSTSKQGHKSYKERHVNVKGAFMIPPDKVSYIKNKSVTLVDDVFTTGATINECTRILGLNGVKEVRVLTLARVITSM